MDEWYNDSIYIKMSGKAEEIQEAWKPSNWDYCYCRIEAEIVILSGYYTDGGCYGHQTPSVNRHSFYTGSCDDVSKVNFKINHIWLSRQDQLQKMIQSHDESSRILLGRFYRWSERQRHGIANAFASMEQLWLAFVMKEKFNKVWDGENWITK